MASHGRIHSRTRHRSIGGLAGPHDLDQTVEVDDTLPGRPPEAERIAETLEVLMRRGRSERGNGLSKQMTVCDQCARTRHEKRIKQIRRTWQVRPDPELCLLEQGLVCCGIATRGGCGALCPRVDSPCIGCYGASAGVKDFGRAMMSALASVIDGSEAEEVDRIVAAGIPDPMGMFYRFGLAHSLMRRRAQREALAR